MSCVLFLVKITNASRGVGPQELEALVVPRSRYAETKCIDYTNDIELKYCAIGLCERSQER